MIAELTVEAGREQGRVYVLRLGQTFVVGRSREVAVRLDDEQISRRHASLELRPDGLYVVDLASRNGTFLTGERLPAGEARRAAEGDRVELGEHALRVAFHGIDDSTRRTLAKTRRLDEPLLDGEEFELMGEIGRGATGRVYAARQKRLDRVVAVKVLRSEVEPEDRERFLREGRICCRVDSPYVVEVHDIRMAHGRAFLVMELVQGPSAKDRLAGGPLPVPEALKVGEDVGRALDAARKAGIVHRDVKPGNILLSPDGMAKLSDFGIAKELDSLESLTSTGEGLGTLAYVAPEQAMEAKKVDHRSDIYSLGATLYHLLAGRPPFHPGSPKVLLDILDKPPPPLATYRGDCPPELAELVHAMLEKDVERRPQRAGEVADRLAELRVRLYPDYSFGWPTPEDRLSSSSDGTHAF